MGFIDAVSDGGTDRERQPDLGARVRRHAALREVNDPGLAIFPFQR